MVLTSALCAWALQINGWKTNHPADDNPDNWTKSAAHWSTILTKTTYLCPSERLIMNDN